MNYIDRALVCVMLSFLIFITFTSMNNMDELRERLDLIEEQVMLKRGIR